MAGAYKLIQDTRYKMQDARCKMQDAGYGIQDAGSWIGILVTGIECRQLMLVTIN